MFDLSSSFFNSLDSHQPKYIHVIRVELYVHMFDNILLGNIFSFFNVILELVCLHTLVSQSNPLSSHPTTYSYIIML